jgi:hypothetical protein
MQRWGNIQWKNMECLRSKSPKDEANEKAAKLCKFPFNFNLECLFYYFLTKTALLGQQNSMSGVALAKSSV